LTARVSVLLPAFHAESYVDVTVESVVNQTLGDWELVAVDDCSPDGTYELLEAWSERDSRIRVRRNSRNRGVTGNWNECLSDARGDLIIKIDADDVHRPRTLELLAKALEAPAVVGAGLRTMMCSETLEPFDGWPADDVMRDAGINPYEDHVLPCAQWYELASRGHQLWAGDGVMIRRTALDAAGGLDERFGCASDTDLIWRVLEGGGNFAHRAYVGVLYRMVASSVSHQSRRQNWLTWEGTVASLLSIARQRKTARVVPRWRRMRYVSLWDRWMRGESSGEVGRTLPAAMAEKLRSAMADVPAPPLKDLAIWRARNVLSRVVV
jgi:glycosyltransferase involved in cell wall biosynthesis